MKEALDLDKDPEPLHIGDGENGLEATAGISKEESPRLLARRRSGTRIISDDDNSTIGEDLKDFDFPSQPSVSAMCLNAMKTAFKNFWTQVINSHPTIWIYLAAVGVLSALLGYLVERSVMGLQRLRYNITSTDNYMANYSAWVFVSLAFVMVAALITHFFQQNAAGSGIPEMKSILGGVVMSKYLTMRTLIAKFFGLCFCLASSIPIGKEGPLVHIAAIVATQTTKIPMFRYIRQNPFLLRQMQSVAVAVGVATCFGAPVGGVLFSIEVTSTVFNVSNLWKCFYGSAWAIVMFRILHEIARVQNYEYTDLNETRFGPVLLLFVLLGILCGCISALFLFLFLLWQKLIERLQLQHNWRRYILISAATISIGVVSYPIKSLSIPDKQISNEMFDNEDLKSEFWQWGDKLLTLPIFVAFKLLFASLAICLPIPAGCLTPVFTAGAVFGRFFGECLHDMDPHSIEPGIFAIVGAAALSSGVTRSLSVTIIVFEVTGELHNLVGVLLASLFAYAVSGAFYTRSIFDLILRCRGLPHLPEINSRAKIAAELMQVEMGYLHVASTYAELEESLQQFHYSDFPLVDQETHPKLVGTIPRHIMYRCLLRHINNYISLHGYAALPDDAQKRHTQYQEEGSPDAADTTKAHMLAWWDEVYANSNYQRDTTAKDKEYEDLEGGERQNSLVKASSRDTRVMQVLRQRGFEVDNEMKQSRSTSMVLNAVKACEADQQAFMRAMSPTKEEGAVFRSDLKDRKEGGEEEEEERAPGTRRKSQDHRSQQQQQQQQQSGSGLGGRTREKATSSIGSLNDEMKIADPEERYDAWMKRTIQLTRFETMAIDQGPFMLMQETPAQRVGFLMSLLGLNQVFVVNRGNLLGVICKEDLFQSSTSPPHVEQ